MKRRIDWHDASVAIVLLIIAICLRLPSCYESLWLDELHTAWTVDASFGDVANRAAAGNQSPTFYWALWLYRSVNLNLPVELSFRLPAVIATSLGACVVYLSLRKIGIWRGSALSSGLCFSLHTHLLFFGTEARVFGAVILLSCVVCHLYITNQSIWWIIHCSLLALAIQPVSAPLFGMVSLAALVHQRCWRNAWEWKPLLSTLLLAISAILSSWSAVSHAWPHRQQWSTFASAHSLIQIWSAFPWVATILVPGAVLLISRSVLYDTKHSNSALEKEPPALAVNSDVDAGYWKRSYALAAISLTTVLVYWLIAYCQLAPIFHRRYFIAALPPLFWFAGIATERIVSLLLPVRDQPERRSPQRTLSWTLGLLAAFAPLSWMIGSESASAKLARGNNVLVRRYEGWREAVQWLQAHYDPATQVYLDAGLIENERMLAETDMSERSSSAQKYLCFPLQGPYRWDNVTAVSRQQWDSRQQLPLVLRANRQQGETLLRRQSAGMGSHDLRITTFGNLIVIDRLR